MTPLPLSRSRLVRGALAPLLVLGLLLASTGALAQNSTIEYDDTPGQDPLVVLPGGPGGNVYVLDASLNGVRNEDETFAMHSLVDFQLADGDIAQVTDDAAHIDLVSDVVIRVTGGNASNIEGRIENLYNDADLIFLNPNGLFFGSNFSIDLQQSFVASTANFVDAVQLSDGATVRLETGEPTALPVFTAVDSPTYGFLGAGADIIIDGLNADGAIPIEPDLAFGFLANNIQMGTGAVSSPILTNGRNLLAVAIGDQGGLMTDLEPDTIPFLTSLTGDPILPTGQILSNADIDTSVEGLASGDLVLYGGEVLMQTGSIFTGGIGSTSSAGDIFLNGRNIEIGVDIDTSVAEFSRGGDVIISGIFTTEFIGGPRVIDTRGGAGQQGGLVVLLGGLALDANRLTINVADTSRGNLTNIVSLTSQNLSFVGSTVENVSSVPATFFAGSFVAAGNDIVLADSTINLRNDGTDGVSSAVIEATGLVDLRNTTIDASSTAGADGGNILVEFGTDVLQDANTDLNVAAVPNPGTVIIRQGDGGSVSDPPFDLPDDGFTPGIDPLQVPDFEPPASGLVFDFVPDRTAGGPSLLGAAGSGEDDREAAIAAAQDEDALSLVAASQADAERKGENDANGSVPIFTNASEHSPLVPRTCNALAAGDRDSKLLARTNQRLPASPEDWLIAYDASGDRLLAAAVAPELAPVAAIADGEATRGGSVRSSRAQRDLAEAALAIRAGRYEEAAEHFSSAVDELTTAGDERGASEAMLAYAQLQLQEGHFAAARMELERALEIAHELDDEAHLAAVRASLGNALIATGELGRAEDELTRGLAVVSKKPKSGQDDASAAVLNNLGNRHAALNDHASARKAFERSAKLARERGLEADEARALLGAARVAIETGDVRAARRNLDRARPLVSKLPSTAERVPLSIHMGRTLGSIAAHSPRYRADALRGAFDAFDDARRSAEEVGDLRGVALANLNLGALYHEEQHRREALYLTRLARRAAEGLGAPEILYRTHWQEGQILWGQHQVEASLAALRRAVGILEETKPIPTDGYGSSDANFRRLVGGVYRDTTDRLLRAASLETNASRAKSLVVEARDVIERFKAAELRNYFEDECIASAGSQGRGIDSLEPGAAVVYTVTLPDRLELLVGLPSGIERFAVPVSATRLNKTIDRFRREVQNPLSRAYRNSGRKLHDWIVKPMQDHLAANEVDTLVFIADGRLRTLPFAALYDGKDHLADRYALASALSLRLLVPDAIASETGRPVLAGVSEAVQGFSPLAAVENEIAEIHDSYGGEVLLNEAFTLDSVRGAIDRETPGIVHLATHAVFSGNPDTSFLLTYAGRVGFDDLSDVVGMTRTGGAPLDLLVLSACETAVGNDRAGLGFTGSAIRAGARSALGSLWPISDAAAGALMVDFYRGLQAEGLNKAHALRKAQADLRADDRFDHPYYWAPFTLVNDWI